MYMDQYISTRKAALNNELVTKAPKANDDALQLGGTLARQLNHDKPHWPNPLTGSSVSYQLCQWDSGEKVIGKIQYFIIYNVKICVKHFGNFHTSRTLVEYKQTIASSDKYRPSKGEK